MWVGDWSRECGWGTGVGSVGGGLEYGVWAGDWSRDKAGGTGVGSVGGGLE